MRIGAITIGHSPRPEITDNMRNILGEEVTIIEKGLLDDTPEEEIKELKEKERRMGEESKTKEIFITRLHDLSSIKLCKEDILPRLKQVINEFKKGGIDKIIILCEGDYEEVTAGDSQIIQPNIIVEAAVNALLPQGKLGVFVPISEQKKDMEEEWRKKGRELKIIKASPYEGTNNVRLAAEKLKKKVDLIVLDSLGFTLEMKKIVRKTTGTPVILPSSIVARTLKELQ